MKRKKEKDTIGLECFFFFFFYEEHYLLSLLLFKVHTEEIKSVYLHEW